MSEQLALLPVYLSAHIQLTLLALLLGATVSFPLGIAATRTPWLERPALAVAGLIQTVPSLALLAIMVPVLAGLNLPSIGFLPAIVGLTLYGILPMLRNTVTGIAGVDAAVKEAAQGVGMTPRQQLLRVELPLAMPVIVAGVRTATVWIVGIATLSTPVGATSLGNYIFSGLQTRNYTAVLVGCISAAALALVLDGLVLAVESGIRTRRRGRLVLSLGTLGALTLFAVGSLVAPASGEHPRPVVIGSKTFTEQYILSDILATWVNRQTGRPTQLVQSLGSTVAFDALDAGEIDVYVDYSGTLWANVMKRGTEMLERGDVLDGVTRFLRDQHGITVAARLGFENAYALAVRADDARQRSLTRISDLQAHAPALVMGGDYEFFARSEWRSIRESYELAFAELRTMDSTLMYQAAALGQVDVISAFSSDGRVRAYDLVVLEDDRTAIPPYDAMVLAGRGLAVRAPDVIAALSQLTDRLPIDRMRALNLAVDEAQEHPAAVAERFIRQHMPEE